MGVENKINLKNMKEKAQSISDHAHKIDSNFMHMYEDVKNMQTYWSGETYADLVTVMNQIDETCNRILEYFCKTLPNEIENKRKQYAKASGKRIIDSKYYGWRKGGSSVTKITIAEQGDEISFNEEKVNELANKINQRFVTISKNLGEIREDFHSITWEGSTGNIMKKTINERTETVEKLLQTIDTSLGDYIRAAKDAMKKAEEGNARTSAAVDTTEADNVAATVERGAEELQASNYDWSSITE